MVCYMAIWPAFIRILYFVCYLLRVGDQYGGTSDNGCDIRRCCHDTERTGIPSGDNIYGSTHGVACNIILCHHVINHHGVPRTIDQWCRVSIVDAWTV